MTLPTNPQTIGERLRNLRKARYLTLKDIESQTKITAATISNLENNLFKPSLEVLMKLAVLYEESIDYIVNGKVDKTSSITPTDHAPNGANVTEFDGGSVNPLFSETMQNNDLLSYYQNAYDLEKNFTEIMKNRYNILKNVVGNLLKVHKEKGTITLDEASITYITNLIK